MHNIEFMIPKILPKKIVWILSLAGTILATPIASAEAGCVDAYATIERVLPLAWGWIIFAIIWYLALAASAHARKEKVSGILSLRDTFLLVIILVIIGFLFLGPAPMFLLFLLSIIGTLYAFLIKPGNRNPLFKKDMKIIGGFVLFILFGIGSGSLYIHFTRAPSDYILNWELTYPGKCALNDLLKRGAEALPDIRVIVEKGRPSSIALAAERLAVIGEPQNDVPLLLNALTSIRSIGYGNQSAMVENALRTLSGIELPEGTATNTWRAEWQKNLQQSVLKRKK